MRVRAKPATGEELTLVQVSSINQRLTQPYIDSFRRFVNDVGSVRNPEYGVNIATGIPNIADYGNIQIESTLD